MSTMDSVLQQLEKRNVQRCPADFEQSQDDELCKPLVVPKGSPKLLDNYNSGPLLRTIKSVGGINSYEFLNREKHQPLNFVKESVDVTRIQANGSMDEQKMHNSNSRCDIPSAQINQEHFSHNESCANSLKHISKTAPIHEQAKLQKQNAIDLGNLSRKEVSGHLSTSLRSGSYLSGWQIDATIAEQNCPSYSDSVHIFGKHQEIQSEVPSEAIENHVPEERLGKSTCSSELLHVEDDKDSGHTSTYRQESLEEEKIRQFALPDEIPAVSGWKLDRRESGHLYWRRDSSTLNGVDPSSRVKFRYDVEVCEFESRGSETDDLLEEDGDSSENFDSEEEMQRKTSKESSVSNTGVVQVKQPFSTHLTFLYIFAALGIVISLLYSWLTYIFFSEHVEKSHKS